MLETSGNPVFINPDLFIVSQKFPENTKFERSLPVYSSFPVEK